MEGYIKKEDRKTILFLADDMRLPSGIGTMTKELILGTAHRYNYVHVGAALQHPDAGKVFDISADINNETGINDSSVILYPFNGYGDPDLVRVLISRHKIDAIVHFTDPRYWVWLYRMSAEIRQRIPIFYYHIWDDVPAPHYNKAFYESCDLLMGISKQSVNISKMVLGKDNYVDLGVNTPKEQISKAVPKTCYVPHGINSKYFFPIDRDSSVIQDFRNKLFGGQNPEYVLLYNNRNIRRKMTSDVILAFKKFYDKLTASKPNVKLVMHTQQADENGTDLPAVIDAICPELAEHIIFTNAKFSSQDLNILYNSCDTVINIGSNEGWGLSSTEAMMCGVPIINNVTGGLQDQCYFTDECGSWIEFNEKFTSNHEGKYRTHGDWVKPVFPAAINLQGSIPTPYIFDDRCNINDVTDAIMYWYELGAEKRKACGKIGHEFVMSEESGMNAVSMCKNYYKAIDKVLENWVAPKRFNLYSIHNEISKKKNRVTGINV